MADFSRPEACNGHVHMGGPKRRFPLLAGRARSSAGGGRYLVKLSGTYRMADLSGFTASIERVRVKLRRL